MTEIFESIEAELRRQEIKHGTETHHPLEWNAILGEEVGEVNTECLEYTFNDKSTDDMIVELTQVAAVAIAWIADLKKKNF